MEESQTKSRKNIRLKRKKRRRKNRFFSGGREATTKAFAPTSFQISSSRSSRKVKNRGEGENSSGGRSRRKPFRFGAKKSSRHKKKECVSCVSGDWMSSLAEYQRRRSKRGRTTKREESRKGKDSKRESSIGLRKGGGRGEHLTI